MNAEALAIDALVVGAGPVGLFQVFELGLLGLSAHVIDVLPEAGGQCITLYADKPIYDIPAMPVVTGRELVAKLLAQIAPFAPRFHFTQQVDVVERQADGTFAIATSAGTRLRAKSIVIAAGVGAFQPRRLKIDGLRAFEGRQLFYSMPELAALAGRRVVVIGDEEAALDAALALSGHAAEVTLVHRRDEFRAAPATVERVRAARANGTLAFVAAQPGGIERDGDRLAALQLLASDGSTRALPLDTLVVLTGLSPRLGPIADWGLALERKQLIVDTASYQTSEPGIFAVGDINTYPGKRKLILCGFHEATLAAYGAAARVRPDDPLHLEYTTTSPRLHRLLGVSPDAPHTA